MGELDDAVLAEPDALGLNDQLPLDSSIVSLVPAIADWTGIIPPLLIPTAIRNPVVANAPTWERLGDVTIREMLMWPAVGRLKVARIFAFAQQFVPVAERSTSVDPSLQDAIASIRTIAAWAVHRDVRVGLSAALELAEAGDAPAEVVDAAAHLTGLGLDTFAADEDVARFDPIVAARRVIDQFEGREAEILERVLAKGLRPVATLEELGRKHGTTRERIRQIEVKIRQRLAQLLVMPEHAVVQFRADELAKAVGRACPVADLPKELTPTPDGDLTDELFSFLAGPFVLAGGWLISEDLPSDLNDICQRAFDSAAAEHAAPIDTVIDALRSDGLLDAAAYQLIEAATHFRVIDDFVVPWQYLIPRIAGVLTVAGKPMAFDDLYALAGAEESRNPNSMRNALASSDLFKRVGKSHWAMSNWEGDEYRGITEHMAEALQFGPQPIAALADTLSTQFGVSPNSVVMYATMHPLFVAANGTVRLRPIDEPFIPEASLELSQSCYVVDGAWAFAVPVDRDILRGSGRWLPEAFATHLGLSPSAHGSMTAGPRAIRVGWSNIRPTIGSLRSVAEDLGLADGDRLFIRRATPSEIDFRFVRASQLHGQSPLEQLRSLVGAAPSETVLERWLGDALGLGGATNPTRAQLRSRLVARDDRDLVALLDAVATTPPPSPFAPPDPEQRVHLEEL